MNPQFVLLVDDDTSSLQTLTDALQSANIRFATATNDRDAWHLLRTEPAISLVVARYSGSQIDGRRLCERIRLVKAPSQLPVLLILGGHQNNLRGPALDAGANDVLTFPMDVRELCNWAAGTGVPTSRRIDASHAAGSVAAKNGAAQQTVVVVPEFNPTSMRLTHNITPGQRRRWDNDPRVTKIPLDTVMLCPECHGVPTFRLGCRNCGCGLTERARLIHHFACAHVGPESEFRRGQELTCPKCKMVGLVAGADFENVDGELICSDCRVPVNRPELIGHCLSCDHRFAACDAVVDELIGYRLQRATGAPRSEPKQPQFHRPASRPAVPAT
ncbi:MAG: response regulator [Planctomycetaceae bacterium]